MRIESDQDKRKRSDQLKKSTIVEVVQGRDSENKLAGTNAADEIVNLQQRHNSTSDH